MNSETIGVLIVAFLVFLGLRELMCWYYKLNQIVGLQKETVSLLKSLVPAYDAYCPVCREQIFSGAGRCPHCRTELEWGRTEARLPKAAGAESMSGPPLTDLWPEQLLQMANDETLPAIRRDEAVGELRKRGLWEE